MIKLTILLFFSCTLTDQTLEGFVTEIGHLKKPNITKITFSQSDTVIAFKTGWSNVIINEDFFKGAQLSVKWNNQTIYKTLSYPIWGYYLDKIEVFDVDNNDMDDILISSYSVGASGSGANIVRVAVLMFFKDSSIVLHELSSNFGGSNLFADFNKDGCYDYACIRQIQVENKSIYCVNIFSFASGIVSNISLSVPEFMVYSEQYRSKVNLVTQHPNNQKQFLFSYPTAWNKN